MILLNLTKQVTLATRVSVGRTFCQRLRGWIGRATVAEQEALVLAPCRSVHTCFVRFPIDVVFLAADGEVVLTLPGMRPFSFSPYVRRAELVVELAAGRLVSTNTAVGDRLVFRNGEEQECQGQSRLEWL